MPDIQAFCGLRYNLGHIGSLSDCIAPPYDVIGPDLQDQLYKRHPANVVRLILNRAEPGDDAENNGYTRAARFLKNWRSEGVLFTEPNAAVYVYHQVFTYQGQSYTRRGFMARVRLERFGEGRIYPHEETMPGPKRDRLQLMRACRANLSQIFGLFPDPDGQAQRILERAIAQDTPVEATDHLGVVHRMWPLCDATTIAELARNVGPKSVYIADGHHRYETACDYRDELAQAGPLPQNHPAQFVLMMLIGMSDPGLIVLPTHRLFRGLPTLSSEELIVRLSEYFQCRVAGEGVDLARNVWDEIEYGDDQGALGFYCAKDERWVLASITAAGHARMAQVAGEHSPAWRGLGVSILHCLVVDTLLGGTGGGQTKYVHLVDEVVSSLETGEFPLAALVMPATVEYIRELSHAHERMPAKSTYFYPKLLSGLVINPLE